MQRAASLLLQGVHWEMLPRRSATGSNAGRGWWPQQGQPDDKRRRDVCPAVSQRAAAPQRCTPCAAPVMYLNCCLNSCELRKEKGPQGLPTEVIISWGYAIGPVLTHLSVKKLLLQSLWKLSVLPSANN